MICLDTNYLIRGLVRGSAEAREIVHWSEAGEPLITSMPAWFEFLCGPVTRDQIATMKAFLVEIVPLSEAHAEEAARLYNAGTRKRALRVDAMIAATAIIADAPLATGNRDHFQPFVAHGLRLA